MLRVFSAKEKWGFAVAKDLFSSFKKGRVDCKIRVMIPGDIWDVLSFLNKFKNIEILNSIPHKS